MSSQNQQAITDVEADNLDEESIEYRCPRCGSTYDNELLARIHITRSEDDAHVNRDGLMPEEDIEIVDGDGNVLGMSETKTEDLNVQDLTVDDITGDYKDQHKHIILVGAYNPYETTYTKLEDEVEEILDEHGLDTPSYSTIRRVIREYFRPQEEKKSEATSEEEDTEELLGDLTPKQQAIVIAHLANPDEDNPEIADRVGSAKSYPGQVYNRAETIINRLNTKIESGEQVEDVVLEELSAVDVQKLYDNDYAENLGIDLAGVIEEKGDELEIDVDDDVFDLPVSEQREAMSASPYESGDPDSVTDTVSAGAAHEPETTEPADEPETAETWGSASESAGTDENLTAESETVEDDVTDVVDSAEDSAEPGETVDETSEPAEAEPTVETTPARANGHVSRAEVEQLREQVKFTREVAEDTVDAVDSPTDDHKMTSLAKRVESQLDEILAE